MQGAFIEVIFLTHFLFLGGAVTEVVDRMDCIDFRGVRTAWSRPGLVTATASIITSRPEGPPGPRSLYLVEEGKHRYFRKWVGVGQTQSNHGNILNLYSFWLKITGDRQKANTNKPRSYMYILLLQLEVYMLYYSVTC